MSSPSADHQIAAFLDWLQKSKGRKPSTLKAYRTDLKSYADYLESVNSSIDRADARAISRYLDSLTALGRQPSTVARATVAIRALYAFLDTHAGTPRATKIKPVKPAATYTKALPARSVDRLLNTTNGSDITSLRDAAILHLLCRNGLRISELVGLDRSDVDVTATRVAITGKYGEQRTIPISKLTAGLLDAWLQARTQFARNHGVATATDAVFLSVRGTRLTRQGAWDMVRKRAAAVKLTDRVSPHALRDSLARQMLNAGADKRDVDRLLGHISEVAASPFSRADEARVRKLLEAAATTPS